VIFFVFLLTGFKKLNDFLFHRIHRQHKYNILHKNIHPIHVKEMNFEANKSYNRYQGFNECVRLRSSMGQSTTLIYRDKKEKVVDRNRLAALGQEENFPAICTNCLSKHRDVVRKSRDNVHYGCVQKCCIMLHQWDMCEPCIVSQHFPEMLVVDETVRRGEAEKFRQVFSNLPVDLQRLVGDFVPQIFDCVRLSKIVIEDPIYGDLDTFVKRPKAVWKYVAERMTQEYASYVRLTKSTSRQTICEEVKKLYDRIYNGDKEVIKDHDYWTEYHHPGVFCQYRLASVAQEIKNHLLENV
jgi:hypothetical protein